MVVWSILFHLLHMWPSKLTGKLSKFILAKECKYCKVMYIILIILAWFLIRCLTPKGHFRVVATLSVNISMIYITFVGCKLGFVKLWWCFLIMAPSWGCLWEACSKVHVSKSEINLTMLFCIFRCQQLF